MKQTLLAALFLLLAAPLAAAEEAGTAPEGTGTTEPRCQSEWAHDCREEGSSPGNSGNSTRGNETAEEARCQAEESRACQTGAVEVTDGNQTWFAEYSLDIQRPQESYVAFYTLSEPTDEETAASYDMHTRAQAPSAIKLPEITVFQCEPWLILRVPDPVLRLDCIL